MFHQAECPGGVVEYFDGVVEYFDGVVEYFDGVVEYSDVIIESPTSLAPTDGFLRTPGQFSILGRFSRA